MGGWVYMTANRYRGTIYTGVTADLARRAWQHRNGHGSTFARRYDALRLVYAERHEEITAAIAREKAIKKWYRAWKVELIEAAKPNWLSTFTPPCKPGSFPIWLRCGRDSHQTPVDCPPWSFG